MYELLKPGGKLFSMFSPIWSCNEGHHLYHIQIPERFSHLSEDKKYLLSNWEHLLKNRIILFQDLKNRFDQDFAELLIYEIFNSGHINRYFYEDYYKFITESKFTLDKIFPTYRINIPQSFQSALEFNCPGYKVFDNMGIYMFVTKP